MIDAFIIRSYKDEAHEVEMCIRDRYTPTNCAERTAIFKAVSEGVREFDTICIVGGKDGIPVSYTHL